MTVTSREGEDLGSLIARWKGKIKREGLMAELKHRTHHESAREKTNRKRAEAVRRANLHKRDRRA